jgi:hypothetical protein
MLRRASLVLLALLVAGSGCTMSAGARRGTIVTGTVMALGGVLLAQSGQTDNDHDGYNDTVLDDNIFAESAGVLLVAAGVGMLLGGLVAQEEPERAEIAYRVPPVAISAPAPTTFASAPGAMQTMEIERVPLIPLPEVPATADVLRLAKQVRSAASHGRCDAAWIMWMDLERLDASYARALREGPVLARCAQ